MLCSVSTFSTYKVTRSELHNTSDNGWAVALEHFRHSSAAELLSDFSKQLFLNWNILGGENTGDHHWTQQTAFIRRHYLFNSCATYLYRKWQAKMNKANFFFSCGHISNSPVPLISFTLMKLTKDLQKRVHQRWSKCPGVRDLPPKMCCVSLANKPKP